jgi:hypothetical protein
VIVYNTGTRQAVKQFGESGDRIFTVAIDPSNQWVAVASHDGSTKIYELTGTRVGWLTKPSSDPSVNVVFSHSGSSAAVVAQSGKILVIDLQRSVAISVPVLTDPREPQVVFSADNSELLVGFGDKALHRLDLSKNLYRQVTEPLPSYFNHLSMDGKGTWIAATGKDGIVRLIKHNNFAVGVMLCIGDRSDDVVVLTPQGWFDGTPEILRQVSWRDGNTNNIFNLEAFYNDFFYPGLLQDTTAGLNPLPPKVDLATWLHFPSLRLLAEEGLAHLEVINGKNFLCLAEGTTPAVISRLNIFSRRGEVDLKDLSERFETDETSATCTRRTEIPKDLTGLELAGSSSGIAKSTPPVSGLVLSATATSTLHIFTVGINSYETAVRYKTSPSLYALAFAAGDADAIEEYFGQQQSSGKAPFTTVRIWKGLRDQTATLPEILSRLNRIGREVSENDVVLLFFAGHGRVPPGQEMFYFMPFVERPESEWSVAPLDERDVGLSSAMLTEALRAFRAHRIVIAIDACESGGVAESLAKVGVAKLAMDRRSTSESPTQADELSGDRTGVFVLAAATPLQSAYEPAPTNAAGLPHGLFTTSLLESLQRATESEGGILMSTVMNTLPEHLSTLAAAAGVRQTVVRAVSGNADFFIARH